MFSARQVKTPKFASVNGVTLKRLRTLVDDNTVFLTTPPLDHVIVGRGFPCASQDNRAAFPLLVINIVIFGFSAKERARYIVHSVGQEKTLLSYQ